MQFQIISLCKSDHEIQLLGTKTKISREKIHEVAIYTEITSIIIFIIYISCLDYVQFTFAEKFDKQSVEMRDFTIKIEHDLPRSFHEFKDEISLKFALWSLI